MTLSRLLKAALVLAAAASVLVSGASAARAAASAVPDQYIVVLKNGVDARAVASEHARTHGVQVLHVYTAALSGYAAKIPAAALAAIKRDPRVDFVQPDEVVNAVQTLPTGVNRIDGDLSSTRSGDGTGSVNVNVAVIDTGIQTTHPDLNVVGGTDCTGSGTYNDGNGHGTHVAGTIAARDDANGVVGIVPGARLWAVRVLNSSGSGTTSTVVCGIDWVTANGPSLGIKVANMSLGGSGSDDNNCGNTNGDAEHRAICNSTARGITYVVAAGNSGTDFRSFVPATYSEVLTTTAMADFDGQPGGFSGYTCTPEWDDSYASFSNYAVLSSDISHTIAAPGVCILSTWLGSSYNTISGTSMASPHMAGTVALCIASGPCSGLSPVSIITKMRADAANYNNANINYGFYGDPIEPISGRYYGYLTRAGNY